ncbi:MAG TPA: hypothetical protein VF488_10295, partial [Gemmatimonadaceae bacterium]
MPERVVRKTVATPQPKLARGTRDISPATLKAARGTRDLIRPEGPPEGPLVPLDTDDDTVVVDTDPNLPEELALDAEAGDAGDAGESSE